MNPGQYRRMRMYLKNFRPSDSDSIFDVALCYCKTQRVHPGDGSARVCSYCDASPYINTSFCRRLAQHQRFYKDADSCKSYPTAFFCSSTIHDEPAALPTKRES